ncbi:Hsp20/alpha crystallin family protein [Candidatus Riflebacteria bacterium]
MALVKYFDNNFRSIAPFRSIFSDLDSFFTDSTPDVNFRSIDCLPELKFTEEDNEYRLQLALPGLKKDDLNMELKDNVLTIEYKAEDSKEEKGSKSSFVSYFRRSLILPKDIDPGKINAGMYDGVLSISMGKTEEAGTRKIQIS